MLMQPFLLGAVISCKIKFAMAGHLKCGCVVGAYWCIKHDIYTGK